MSPSGRSNNLPSTVSGFKPGTPRQAPPTAVQEASSEGRVAVTGVDSVLGGGWRPLPIPPA